MTSLQQQHACAATHSMQSVMLCMHQAVPCNQQTPAGRRAYRRSTSPSSEATRRKRAGSSSPPSGLM